MQEYCYNINGQCRNIVAIFMDNAGIFMEIHKYCCNISGHFKDVDGIFLDSASILMENFWTVQGYCCNISGHCWNIVHKWCQETQWLSAEG